MEDLNKVPRFSSCRWVSFEVKPRQGSPFDMEPPSQENCSDRPVWLPWTQRSSFKVFPTLSEFGRTASRSSSHFCDLDDDDVEEGDAFPSNDALQVANDIEKQQAKEAEQPIQATKRNPSVRKSKPSESRLSIILLDQGLFTVYKRLFAVCFTLNMIGVALAITGHFPYAKKRAAAFAIYNILALTLCRSEAFLRIVFWLAVKVLGRPWVPLFIKTAATSFLQSIGGIHSSCGISSVAWLIYALVLTLNHRENTSDEIIAVASTILSLLCFSCMVWVYVVLTVGYDPATKSYDNLKGSRLAKRQELWLTVAITIFTILPWLTVRRVPVSVTAPSGHASIIKFAGGIKAGILGRISRLPLSEWHAFGIISDGKDGHMMLAGAVGDFTRCLVSDPPNHLWVRGVRFAGLPYLVNMYSRAVLVATGSGICVFLSFLLQPCAEIKEMMSGHPKEKVIVHDTAVSGRPNVAQMTIDAARNWKAEVVVVTSNPQGSRDVVDACKAVGIPAFGPIWDS
ncbi:adenylate-forming reductase 06235 [Phoenix dactylifera]|uniref:Adenylate-forming reductase 06235 n=1 Tax=Phoenix dactylifera TaxID=42345 RepID=A0A8B8IZG5_PHODC|nr:adenylate-forming reductase 06235 [Phoenix dactylifera]